VAEKAMHRKTFGIAVNVIAVILALLWIVPVCWMILMAFRPQDTDLTNIISWFTPPFTLENFNKVLDDPQANILLWIGNSILVAGFATSGSLLIALMASFAFSRIAFVGKSVVWWLVVAGLIIPLEAILLPLYLLARDLGLLNTYISLIAPLMAAPFSVIILKQFVDQVPSALFDAAKIDGCGWFRMLFTIVIPLSKAAIGAVSVFVFLTAWNDFLWPFISVTKPERMTIPIGLPFFQEQFTALTIPALPLAASTLTALPIIVAFLIFQKYIIKGIAMTGIKG